MTTFQRNIFLPILLLVVTAAPLSAKSNYYSRYSRNAWVCLEATTYVVSSLYLSVFLHELAHAAAAKAAGAKDIRISMGIDGGVTEFRYTPDVSEAEKGVIFASGLATNRLLAFGAGEILDATDATGWPARWGATFYLINRVLIIGNWTIGITNHTTDYNQLAELISPNNAGSVLVYVGFGLLLAADVYLTWDEINRNLKRAIGDEDLAAETSAHRFIITPTYAAYRYRF